MIAIPTRTRRVVERVLNAELCCGGGGGLDFAMVPSRKLVQRVWDDRDSVRVEKRSRRLRLLSVEAGATAWMEAGLFAVLFLAGPAYQETLAS